MSDSCSHWWHALFYVAISLVLAFVITTTIRHSTTPAGETLKRNNNLFLNASRTLRSHGFNIFATLIQFSPHLFLESSPEITIFAFQDSVIFSSNSTSPLQPWMMKQLIQYHTSPSKLPMNELLKKPQGSCLKTLLNNKYIEITEIDQEKGFLEINNVLISHLDMFVDGPISIHGVLGPFNGGAIDQDWNFIQSSSCDEINHSLALKSKISLEEWSEIVKWLNSDGFVSFAIGLDSVLDGIFQDSSNLSSVTILAPPYFAFISLPSPLMQRIVRLHILPQKFSYRELANKKSSFRTLDKDKDLKIKRNNFSHILAIDEVEIVQPDLFSTAKFVIHGISQALEMQEISGSF